MKEPIGFLPCRACGEVKNIYQGEGRNAAFLYAKCGCGTDTRKGDTVQKRLAAHTTREEAESALKSAPEPQSTPQAEPEQTPQQTPSSETKKLPSSALGWAGFALVAGAAFLFKKARVAA